MYIEPCCIDRRLPELLEKEPFCFFQSNGDWTVTDLMKAVSWLAEGGVALLAVPDADVFLLRSLCTYLAKGWYRALVLVTREDRTELVRRETGSMLPSVHYAFDSRLEGGMLALTDFDRYLAVQGPMPVEKDFRLCHYAAYYGRSYGTFLGCVEAVLSVARTSPAIRSGNDLVGRFLKRQFV